MKTYIIKKGEHYSAHPVKPYFGKTSFKVTVNFDESCRYDLGGVDQLDVNKLFGVSFGNHEVNSIRIGWAYNLETLKMDIYTYTYENSVRKINKIGSCSLAENVVINLKLNFGSSTYQTNSIISIPQEQVFAYSYPALKAGYYLYPYFGGNNPAPHEMSIQMDFE